MISPDESAPEPQGAPMAEVPEPPPYDPDMSLGTDLEKGLPPDPSSEHR